MYKYLFDQYHDFNLSSFHFVFRPTPQKSGAAASGGGVSPHASAVQNMLENGLTQFMQFRAQAAQAAHAVHASAAAAQAEHLLRNIGKTFKICFNLQYFAIKIPHINDILIVGLIIYSCTSRRTWCTWRRG